MRSSDITAHWPSWQTVLFDRPAGQVIAAARIALASFALLAIWLDPTQPDRYPALTYSVLALYVAHAAVMATLSPRAIGSRADLFAHVIDVFIIGLLIYLTEGPSSPFFVLVTFALISATLHWGARGALVTGATLVGLQLVVSIDGIGDIDRFVMRGGYLIIGAALFAYYGAYRDRTVARLAALSNWPGNEASLGEQPALDGLLRHTGDVMQSDHVVVVWETEQSPQLLVSSWTRGEPGTTGSHPPEAFAPNAFGEFVAPELADVPFVIEANDSHSALTANGRRDLGRPAVSPSFLAQFKFAGRLASAPFQNADAQGHVFFLGSTPFGDDVYALVQLVSGRIGNRIQHHQVNMRLQQAALVQERARFAHDLHDSTLQVMTAAALELKQMEDQQLPGIARDQLSAIRLQLAEQQRKIRSFIDLLREAPTSEQVSLAGALGQTLSKIEDVWNCATRVEVCPPAASVLQSLRKQIDFVVMEAAANACRHGKAKTIAVAAQLQPDCLTLHIRDDGAAIPELAGTFDHHELAAAQLGPVSLRNRITALGGQMSLSSDAQGVELKVVLPLK